MKLAKNAAKLTYPPALVPKSSDAAEIFLMQQLANVFPDTDIEKNIDMQIELMNEINGINDKLDNRQKKNEKKYTLKTIQTKLMELVFIHYNIPSHRIEFSPAQESF